MRSSKKHLVLWPHAFAALLLLPIAAFSHSGPEPDQDQGRECGARETRWQRPDRDGDRIERLRIISFNDFHGHLSAGQKVSKRPVGGAAVLASWIEDAESKAPGEWIVVHGGDHVGASPPVSGLLQDEPSLDFLNLLAGPGCRDRDDLDKSCRMVGTVGNHEFDQGRTELMRKLRGGNSPNGPFLDNPWKGVHFPYVNANVVDSASGRNILPPYVVKEVRGIPVAFVGIVLSGTPSIVSPAGVAGLRFLDEAESINRVVRHLRRRGVKAIVVLIHQGASQTSYTGNTLPEDSTIVTGDLVGIVQHLDPGVDAIVSAHTHTFLNALLPDRGGNPVLVTQAWSYGTAIGEIDLDLDRRTHDVVGKRAIIQTTWADEGPGLSPDPMVADLVTRAEAAVAPIANRVVARASTPLSQSQNAAGESPLGDLIADAQRAALSADVAVMNPGGIRGSLDSGSLTWGALFTIQPFGNVVYKLRITGKILRDLLEEQWLGQSYPKILQISGFSYTWDASAPVGSRVVEIRKDGQVLSDSDTLQMAVNNFVAGGGDGFVAAKSALSQVVGPADIDVLVQFVQSLPQPVSAPALDRIHRLN